MLLLHKDYMCFLVLLCGKNATTLESSETIEFFGRKSERCSQLNENIKKF